MIGGWDEESTFDHDQRGCNGAGGFGIRKITAEFFNPAQWGINDSTGVTVEEGDLKNHAPTVARALGIELADAEGHAVEALLQPTRVAIE